MDLSQRLPDSSRFLPTTPDPRLFEVMGQTAEGLPSHIVIVGIGVNSLLSACRSRLHGNRLLRESQIERSFGGQKREYTQCGRLSAEKRDGRGA